jgi:hypothetical protein
MTMSFSLDFASNVKSERAMKTLATVVMLEIEKIWRGMKSGELSLSHFQKRYFFHALASALNGRWVCAALDLDIFWVAINSTEKFEPSLLLQCESAFNLSDSEVNFCILAASEMTASIQTVFVFSES